MRCMTLCLIVPLSLTAVQGLARRANPQFRLREEEDPSCNFSSESCIRCRYGTGKYMSLDYFGKLGDTGICAKCQGCRCEEPPRREDGTCPVSKNELQALLQSQGNVLTIK